MAHSAGKIGGIYYKKATITADTIAFVDSDPDTITDSGDGFVTAGFEAGDYITVTGAGEAGNNDTWGPLATAVAGTLTLPGGDTLTAEIAGETVTIVEASPGTASIGGYGWSLDYAADPLETTDFADSGKRTYIAGVTQWTGSMTCYWDAADPINEWTGTIQTLRLFTDYQASPDVTSCHYYEGDAVITMVGTQVQVDDVIRQTVNFQGTGALTFTTRSTAWDT